MFKTPKYVQPFLLALLCLAMTACSQDRHEYISTVNLPTTVTIYDPNADESLWSMDVPVGQKLVIDLDRENENETMTISGLPATLLTWELYDLMTKDLVNGAQVALAGTPIMIKVNYRPSPEYPPGYEPPYPTTAPVYQAAPVDPPATTMPSPPSPPTPPAPSAPIDEIEEIEKIEAEAPPEAPLEEPLEEPVVEPIAEDPAPQVPPAPPVPMPDTVEAPEPTPAPDGEPENAVREVAPPEKSPLDIELEMELEQSLEGDSDSVEP